MSNKKIAQSKNSILLDIDGMKCGSCVLAVEKILKSHPNTINASVNLVTKTAFLEIKEPNNSLPDLIQTLTYKGFPSKERPLQTIENKSESEAKENKKFFSGDSKENASPLIQNIFPEILPERNSEEINSRIRLAEKGC